MRAHIVAGLDLGSTKTAAVIAEVVRGGPEPRVRVLGVGQTRTGGVRREVVTDLEATTESVRKAVKEAELMAGVAVDRLWAGIAGEHIRGRASSGVVAVSGPEIGPRDLERVHEVARAVALPADQELLHAIPQEYRVDAQGGIYDPVGMTGLRLEAEVFLITAAAAFTQNVRKSIARAGYAVEGLVFEPLASALATVSEEEQEQGVAVVELGGGTTDFILFHDRKIRAIGTLPWGGTTVTHDIAKVLALPYSEAAQIKDQWGVALSAWVDPQETIEHPAPGGGTRRVPRELLAHIIEQRLDEIFGLVRDQMLRSQFGDRLGSGVVLTGGGALLPGITELAERSLGLPVRVGTPERGLEGLADSLRRPKFATAAGLVLYAARLRSGGERERDRLEPPLRSARHVLRRVRDWLADFF